MTACERNTERNTKKHKEIVLPEETASTEAVLPARRPRYPVGGSSRCWPRVASAAIGVPAVRLGDVLVGSLDLVRPRDCAHAPWPVWINATFRLPHVLSWYCLSVLPSMLRGDAKRSGAGTVRRRGRGGDKTMTRNEEAFDLPSLLLKLEIL